MNLEELRVEIDKIDSELVTFLERRMTISKMVGEYKKERDLPVLNINREIEVIKKVTEKLDNAEYKEQLENIYFEIMKTSRSLQTVNSDISYGLLGAKLSHSASPKIHKTLFNLSENTSLEYGLFEIEESNLDYFVKLSEKYNIKGFNVTIPYKVDVMKFLDEIDDVAKNIGSVNTVKLENGKKIGYNTDYFGFETLVKENGISFENKNVIILGSGGSSKTVEYFCKCNKVSSVHIVTRNKTGKDDKFVDYNDLTNMDYDIIVNTTPVGMFPNIDNSPIDSDLVSKASAVIDIIANPKQTKLLAIAEENQIKNCNGKIMLLAQALKAQEIWGICKCNDENLGVLKNENYDN